MVDAIGVLIVDDHPMVRRGLRSLLSLYSDLKVVGEAGDAATALRMAAELQIDIVLLDIRLPGSDGLTVAYQIGREAPKAKIIVLTAYENDEYVFNALKAGAYAYLLKSTHDETVVETIRLVQAGQRLLSPSLIDKVLRQFQTLAQTHARQESGLSGQELSVLAMIARGATNTDIARETFWSERTVKRKVEEIVIKLGVRNRAQAVAEAVKRGLV